MFAHLANHIDIYHISLCKEDGIELDLLILKDKLYDGFRLALRMNRPKSCSRHG